MIKVGLSQWNKGTVFAGLFINDWLMVVDKIDADDQKD